MQHDVVIIGGGIVGLASAWQIQSAQPRLKIAVLEKEGGVARHQTGHNSGVIHSGIYYKPGSAKALNCVRGYRLLREFCDANGVPYEICGKLLVATDTREAEALPGLHERGEANGLTGIRHVPQGELTDYEPTVAGLEALWIPQTGIIDYTRVTQTLAERFVERGGTLHLGEKVTAITRREASLEIVTDRAAYPTRLVINCGGLQSDLIASLSGAALDVRIIPFRGEYYKLRDDRKHLVRNLIYPVPDPAFPFLGVHFTRGINGDVEAGPNAVFAFRREGYRKSDIALKELAGSLLWPGFRRVAGRYWRTGAGEFYRSYSKRAFTRALQRLIPTLRQDDLLPGGSGVRAQACSRDGKLVDDFLIQQDDRVINLLNAPSPAATSCLAIGETIARMAQGHL
ncbi:MAG: L-2-hydroxyglutarate oxidase [Armatimonadota bacterium]